MSILATPRAATDRKSSTRPLTVSLTLTINHVAYEVVPIAPGPDNTRAYRLVKQATQELVYDVCRTTAGLVECDCPSYESTYRGNGLETCKHGRAPIMVGLLEYPQVETHKPLVSRDIATANKMDSDEPSPNRDNVTEWISPTPDAYTSALAKLDVIAEVELVVRAEATQIRDDVTVSGLTPQAGINRDHVTVDSPAPVVPAFDREPYRAANAVAEGKALWLSHRHLHTSAPLPSVNQFRDVTNMVPAACCPDDEPMPCQACLTHDGPADLSDDAWDDSATWELGPDDDRMTLNSSKGHSVRTMAERVEEHARELRAIGSPLHDLLAERAESLAAEIRYLGASTVVQYRDRREAALDAARDAAEARLHSGCC